MTSHTPENFSTAEALLIAIIKNDVAVIAERRRMSDDDLSADDNDGARRGRGPDQAPRKRMSPTAETRAKLREAAKRHKFGPLTAETRAKLSVAMLGNTNRKKSQPVTVSPVRTRRASHG